MPELPEVETVRRILARHVEGRRVERVEVGRHDLRRPLDGVTLGRVLPGRRLETPRRRGKFLILDTAPPGALLVHLGMSGRLMLQDPGAPRLPHTHLVLGLDDGRELRLVDPRRFGLAVWLEPGEEATDPALASLGLEPFAPGFEEALPARLAGRRAPVKALLLDQRIVAGIGNIYAAEALWRAGIRPTRQAARVSRARLARLAASVCDVLAEAVEQGGTTIRDFATPEGDFGYFAVRLQVYGRDGRPCPRCTATLHNVTLAGRATAFCPRCQT